MHRCKAGVSKLVVMYDGNIIPCEAFKGLLEKYPEFILGNIRKGDTLESALERAEQVPFLQWIQAMQKFEDQVTEKMCSRCEKNLDFKGENR